MNEAGWVAVVVAFLTGAGGWLTAASTKRKIDADSESVSISTMTSVLKTARDELKRANDELRDCRTQRADVMKRLGAAENRINSLEAYLKLNHNIDPEEINGEPI